MSRKSLPRILSVLLVALLVIASTPPVQHHLVMAQGEGGTAAITGYDAVTPWVRMENSVAGIESYGGRITALWDQRYVDYDSDIMFDEDFAFFEQGSNYTYYYGYNLDGSTIISNTSDTASILFYATLDVAGTELQVNRTLTILDDLPLVIVTTTVKNIGTEPLEGYEFYDYNDVDLASFSNDYIEVPFHDGVSRMNVEAYVPADELAEPWLWQKDPEIPLSVAFIIGTQDLFKGAYIGYYHSEDPPDRVYVNGETITTGDIVVALSWTMDLDPGEEATYTFAYAFPSSLDELRELIPVATQYAGIVFKAEMQRTAFWGQLVPLEVSLSKDNQSNTSIGFDLEVSPEAPLGLLNASSTISGTLASGSNTSYTWMIQVPSGVSGIFDVVVRLNYTIYNDTTGGEIGNGTITRILPLKVIPSPYMYTIFNYTEVSAGDTVSIIHPIPDSIYHYTNVTVGANPDVLYFEEVRGLIGYPYGCAEQRTSKLLALLNVFMYLQAMDQLTPEERSEYIQYIVGGALETVDLQHEDGGWGWFVEYSSTPFFTAYVMEGLAQTVLWADEEGVYLPPSNNGRTILEALESGAAYLAQQQTGDGRWLGVSPDYVIEDNLVTAYILNSLILAFEAGAQVNVTVITNGVSYLVSQILSNNGGIGATPTSTADALATALALSVIHDYVTIFYDDLGGQATQAIDAAVSWLESNAIPEGDTLHWEIDYYVWSGSTSVVTATAIEAIYKVQGASDAVTAGLLWLIDNYEDWLYSNTRTGAVVVGTLDLLAAAYSSSTSAQVSVYVNGELVWQGAVNSGEQYTFNVSTLVGGNDVTIETSGQGTVYVIVSTAYWSSTQLAPIVEGLADVEPVYSFSAPTGEQLSMTWLIGGQDADGSVQTTLRIESTGELLYLVIEVPLPPGFTIDPDEVRGQGYAVDTLEPTLAIPVERLPAGTTEINLTLVPMIPGATLDLDNLLVPRIYMMYNTAVEAYASVVNATSQQPGGGEQEPTPQTPEENQTPGETPTPTTNETTNETTEGQGILDRLPFPPYMLAGVIIVVVILVIVAAKAGRRK